MFNRVIFFERSGLSNQNADTEWPGYGTFYATIGQAGWKVWASSNIHLLNASWINSTQNLLQVAKVLLSGRARHAVPIGERNHIIWHLLLCATLCLKCYVVSKCYNYQGNISFFCLWLLQCNSNIVSFAYLIAYEEKKCRHENCSRIFAKKSEKPTEKWCVEKANRV